MIRLINRRLIIPRGDTGSFTVPVLTNSSAADISVFTIFDCLTRRKIFQKEITAADNTLTVEFTHEDTVNLVPGRYVWDIKYYKNPTYADGELIDGEEVDSYYAGFSLPICEIKETGDTLLLADDAPTSTMSPLQLNVINAAISEANVSKRDAATSASAAATSASEANASAAAALQSQTSAEDAAGAAIDAKNAATSASETAVSAQENAAAAESNAQDAASTATTKAEEASQSAADALSAKTDALAAVSEISNLQIQTTTLNPTSTATASYNSNTGILSLGIPRGHGVASITKTNTQGLVDTYTILFSDGNSTTFNISNGAVPSFTIGTVTEGPTAAVTVTGTNTNPVLNLTLPNANVPTAVSELSNDAGYATESYVNTAISNVNTMKIHICTAAEYNSETGVPTIVNPDIQTFYLVPGGEGNNLFIEWAYVNNAWERFGSADVDLSNYVQKTDYASSNEAGVIKASSNVTGIGINNEGFLYISPPTKGEIKTGTDTQHPVTPSKIKEATFYGLAKAAGDSTQSASSNAVGTYTNEAKAAIQQMLDVPSTSDIPEVPVQDVQVAGSSVVGSDGVASIPAASLGGDYGTIKLQTITASSGLTINANGYLQIADAQPQNYHVGTTSNPMTIYYMNYATFYGLARAAGVSGSNINATGGYNSVGQYTEEAKTAIKEMLGVQDGLKVVRLI